MERLIKIIDSGNPRYTLEPSHIVLGRMYDHDSEELVVEIPKSESESVCTLIIADTNKTPLYSVEIKDGRYKIPSIISQHHRVLLAFSFTRNDGYIKGSEIAVGDFESTIKPFGFEPIVSSTSLEITPQTNEQVFVPETGAYYDKVSVGAVTSSIDENISPLNIRKGVSILGVNGNIISNINQNEVYFTNETGSGAIIGHIELDDTYDLYGYTNTLHDVYYTSDYTFLKNKKTGETEKILDTGFQQFEKYNEDIICLAYEGSSNVIYNYKTKQTIFSYVNSRAGGNIYVTTNSVIFSGSPPKIYSFSENKEIDYYNTISYSLNCLKIDEHRVMFNDYYLPVFDDRTNTFIIISDSNTNLNDFEYNKVVEFNGDKYFCRKDNNVYRVNGEFTKIKNKISCNEPNNLSIINNNLYVCGNAYKTGGFYKIDIENNVTIEMKGNLSYCNLCITNGTNAIIFNSTKNQFFNGKTETFTDLASTGIRHIQSNESFNKLHYNYSYLILDKNNIVYLEGNSKCCRINLETGEEIISSVSASNTNRILKGKDYLLVFGNQKSTQTAIYKIKISDMSTTKGIMQAHGNITFKQIDNKYYIYQGLAYEFFYDTYVVSTFDITNDEFKLYKIGSIDYI